MINPHTKARPNQHVMHTGVSNSSKSMANTIDELAEYSQVVLWTPEEPHARHPTVVADFDAESSSKAPADSKANNTAAEIDSKARMPEHPQTLFGTVRPPKKQPTEQQQGTINPVHSVFGLIRGLGATSNGSAHAIKERSDNRITRLEFELGRLQKANDRLERHAHLREQAFEKQHLQNFNKYQESHRNLIEEHNMRYNKLRAICEQKVHDGHERAMHTVQGAQKMAWDMSERYEASQRLCRELEKEISTLKVTVRSMQSAQMESADATRWPPQPASTIEHKLKVLLSHVRQWANRHAKLPFEELSDNRTFQNTVNGLVDRGCLQDPARLLKCLMNSKVMQNPGKASSLILTAAVTFDITHKIIGDPFFAFSGRPEEDTLSAHYGQVLTGLLKELKSSKSWQSSESLFPWLTIIGNEKSCEAVRCQILRLLQPATNNQSESAGYIRYVTERSQKSAVSALAATIMEEFMGEQSEDERIAARMGLESIMLEAAELSSSLWTRMARIETANLPALSAIEESALVYRSSSESLEPHSIHGMDLEADPESLDGCDVVLLCSPAVFRAGSSDGEDYHKRSLLKKAVVWLG